MLDRGLAGTSSRLGQRKILPSRTSVLRVSWAAECPHTKTQASAPASVPPARSARRRRRTPRSIARRAHTVPRAAPSKSRVLLGRTRIQSVCRPYRNAHRATSATRAQSGRLRHSLARPAQLQASLGKPHAMRVRPASTRTPRLSRLAPTVLRGVSHRERSNGLRAHVCLAVCSRRSLLLRRFLCPWSAGSSSVPRREEGASIDHVHDRSERLPNLRRGNVLPSGQ